MNTYKADLTIRSCPEFLHGLTDSFTFQSFVEWESKLTEWEKLSEEKYQTINITLESADDQEIAVLFATLFAVDGIYKDNLEDWMEWEEQGNDTEDCAKLYYLLTENGCDFEDAITRIKDVYLSDESLEATVEEFMSDCYFTKKTDPIFKRYFNYVAYGQDLLDFGDWVQFAFCGRKYICINATSL